MLNQPEKRKINTSMMDAVHKKKIEQEQKMPSLSYNETLELDEILRLGTDYKEQFSTNRGNITIRPLSVAEKNKASYRGLLEIANTETLDKMWANMKKKEKTKLETPYDQINLVLYSNEENAWLVMLSMKDFNNEIDEIIEKKSERKAIDFIKKNFDINKIVKRIKYISGLTKDSQDAVKSFQEDLSRTASDLRNESVKDKNKSINTESHKTSEIPSNSANQRNL